jgi:tyrosyl-tRNA synthetase
MNSASSLLDALRAREMLHQHSEGLVEHLARGPISAYCGFDPTAPSLHVGNLVPAMGLLRVVEAGHRAIALVGGGTALIGDPSGKSAERPLLSPDDVAANGVHIANQLRRILGDRVTMADNAEWLRPLGVVEFLRDTGKHFPVNQMLAKDVVKSRLDAGISFTEFSYMLLQAYDYLQLYQRHEVTLQIGGSDQWGNITAGTELIRRAAGGDAHAVTFPLLTTASGTKFGKTEAGAVWLDPNRTSPYAFYQFWVNSDDADVMRMMRIFTLIPGEELAAIESEHIAAPHKRLAQRRLASDVTTRVHSADDAERARAASEVVFDKSADPRGIDDAVFEMLAANVRVVRRGGAALPVPELLEAAFGVSRSQGRKLVAQGGVSVNGARLAPETTELSAADAVRGRWMLLRKGARDVAVVEMTTDA